MDELKFGLSVCAFHAYKIMDQSQILTVLLIQVLLLVYNSYSLSMNRKNVSKIIILGDSSVGKTSLLNAYVDQKFFQSYKATIGADFMEKEVIVDGKVVSLEIWDTAGQERFRCLGGAFYRGADGCVLVYDITHKKSFQSIESWIDQFLNQGSPKEPEKFPFILVGNKIDCTQGREVYDSDVQVLLAKYPRIKHFTTSAKNGQGVQVAFENMALASIQNKQVQILIPFVKTGKLNNKKPEKRKICC